MTPTIELAREDFDYVRGLVRERSAIVLEPGKEYLVHARLLPVAHAEGMDGIAPLVRRLRAGDPVLLKKVVEAMTTNETSFFRDVQPFEVLRNDVIPTLTKLRATERTLNIWSAASSSGQEAYSIGMVLREHFPELAGWQVRILGTDLSQEMVDRSRDGRYSQIEINRGLPAPMLVKYFTRDGVGWRVKPELQALTEFRQMNLATAWLGIARMDVVFLRNVLIYFDMPTRLEIMKRLSSVLRPDGYLFLGGAETPGQTEPRFERVPGTAANCYRIVAPA